MSINPDKKIIWEKGWEHSSCPLCCLTIEQFIKHGSCDRDTFCEKCLGLLREDEKALPMDFDDYYSDNYCRCQLGEDGNEYDKEEDPDEKEKVKKQIIANSKETYISTALTPRWVKAQYDNMHDYLEDNDPEDAVIIDGIIYTLG